MLQLSCFSCCYPLLAQWEWLFFLTAAVLVTSEPVSGAVICPAAAYLGTELNCFVSDVEATNETLTVHLVDSASQVASVGRPSPASPGLWSLPIGSVLALGTYTVTTYESGAATSMVEVDVVAEPKLVIVESDRRLYKPGQTARFRALVVTAKELFPQAACEVSLEVTAPSGFKLLQLVAETSSAGVAEFEFPIASEPLMGDHAAKVAVVGGGSEGSVHEITFGVEEYVLPRFEVTLTTDQTSIPTSYSNSGSSQVSGSVNAVYVFGEKVAGKVSLTILRDAYYNRYSASSEEITYEVLATSEVDLSGEAKDFSLTFDKSYVYPGDSLVIEASVVDSATQEQQNGTAKIPVIYQGSDLTSHLEFADGGGIFKPGLPVPLKVTLYQPGRSIPTSEFLASAGELKLVMSQTFVSYDYSWQTTKKVLQAGEFTDGMLTTEMTVPVDDSSCCDALADASTEAEYLSKKGCCTSSVNWWVELDGVTLYADHYSSEASVSHLCGSRAYAPSGYFMSIVPPTSVSTDLALQVQSTLDFASLGNRLSYFVIHGGTISSSGTSSLHSVQDMSGYWEATAHVSLPEIASGVVKVVVEAEVQATGAMVSASWSFERPQGWSYNLTAAFSKEEVLPGQSLTVDLSLPADAQGYGNATVFLTSLDRSAELLGSRATINAASVLSAVNRARQGAAAGEVAPRAWRLCSSLGYQAVALLSEVGLDSGLVFAANTSSDSASDDDQPYGSALGTRCPRPITSGCSSNGGDIMDDMAGVEEDEMDVMDGGAEGGVPAASPPSSSSADPGRTVTVRRNFPETWIWSSYAVEGSKGVEVTAPDTITTWTLEAFATSPEGISAVRAETGLLVFKPFFVEMRLPYSAMRGEELPIYIAIFNYANTSGSLSANVVIELPDGLALTSGSLSQTVEVESGAATSLEIHVRPLTLGSQKILVSASASSSSSSSAEDLSDALEKALLVKPEGFEVRRSQNLVLELSNSTPSIFSTIDLEVPDVAVQGSVRASVAVVGDLLGPTISGLEGLLRIPTGCGEQNMITLAPNVYVAKYLLSVDRLKPDTKQRIIRNLIVGYGRELTYRHPDGSFSAFGTSDDEGSTWLTAFVLKTFAEIHDLGLVTLDLSVLGSAADYLRSTQAASGAFESHGNVIHQEMMGGMSGSSTESSLTSYVLLSLVKAQSILNSASLTTSITKASSYLQTMSSTKIYTKLLRSYALAASGAETSQAMAEAVLAWSSQDATSGVRYWSSSTTSAQETELSAYALMILCAAGSMSEALETARYLLKRRTSSGGFESTQDTVVALGALATYAAAVAGSVDVSVTLAMESALEKTMQVDSSNIDVLQSISITWPFSQVNVSASGDGTVLVIPEVVYNLPELLIEPCYDLQVEWSNLASSTPTVRACMEALSSCDRPSEGMWLMSVGLFTGYSPVVSSLLAQKTARRIKRYETQDRQVDFYLDDVATTGSTCLEFQTTRDYDVQSLQNASSQVFEYYDPQRRGQASTMYADSGSGGGTDGSGDDGEVTGVDGASQASSQRIAVAATLGLAASCLLSRAA